ncbi:ABC transporter permease [Plantactinospora sp. CA-290183]|uniref:ABC transporter permease n=1 Tax=Plantactinospora sp. CA-290183 TaxID=3240006 RepID=UPI003D904A89
MFRAELVKLKRSTTWLIALVLPFLAVTTAAINVANNPDTLDSGWESFTSQAVLFYGLLFFSMGIGLIAATAWRVEHRGTNWNLLLTTTTRPIALVLAKIAVIAVPVAFMQVVLVIATLFTGTFVLNVDGAIPWKFTLAGLLAIVAALPLIAAQSLLSMLLKSFGAPIAICLVGCVAAVPAITSPTLRPLRYLVPQALNTRTLNLGSVAVADSGDLIPADVISILATALVMTAIVAGVSVVALRKIKLR